VVDVLKNQGVADLAQLEGAVLALREERIRADFTVKLRAFLETLDTVLPDPAGLPYVRDARLLGFIARCASAHYRDGQVDLRGVGEKVRKLIDDHIRAEGVEVMVEPISILDVRFDDAVNRHVSDRAKASEMEHALRAHIRQHFEEDPVRFQKLSERLERVLTALKDNWAEILKAYRALMEDVRDEAGESAFGLDPRIQAPFARVLLEEMGAGDAPEPAQVKRATEVTLELVDHVRQEIRRVDFWRNSHAQQVLKGWVFELLDRHDLVDFGKARGVADRLVDLAKALHDRFVE
jgi:type I restriction enzyme R subunit